MREKEKEMEMEQIEVSALMKLGIHMVVYCFFDVDEKGTQSELWHSSTPTLLQWTSECECGSQQQDTPSNRGDKSSTRLPSRVAPFRKHSSTRLPSRVTSFIKHSARSIGRITPLRRTLRREEEEKEEEAGRHHLWTCRSGS